MRDDPEELEAIAGPCTPEQESAVQLFSCLQEVHRGILSVRSSVKLDAVPAQMLADASDELEGAAMEVRGDPNHLGNPCGRGGRVFLMCGLAYSWAWEGAV